MGSLTSIELRDRCNVGCYDPELSTKLIEEARAGSDDKVAQLLRDGASANFRDEHGWRSLHYSAASGNLGTTRALLVACGEVNACLPDFSTPLMLAAEEGHLEVARLLLGSGAQPELKDEDGFTAGERADPKIRTEFKTLAFSPDNISRQYTPVRASAEPG